MSYTRLKRNLQIMDMHNHGHGKVIMLTGGQKTETQVIDEIVSDCREILDKIENVTLIELKYPLHKAVYFLRNGAVEEGVIVSFNYNRYTNPKMWYSIEYYIPALKSYYVEVVREDMVYPTREEVEKRLKGAQK